MIEVAAKSYLSIFLSLPVCDTLEQLRSWGFTFNPSILPADFLVEKAVLDRSVNDMDYSIEENKTTKVSLMAATASLTTEGCVTEIWSEQKVYQESS